MIFLEAEMLEHIEKGWVIDDHESDAFVVMPSCPDDIKKEYKEYDDLQFKMDGHHQFVFVDKNNEKKYKTKQIICPKCGSHNVAEYLYGMPAWSEKLRIEELMDTVIIGGCCPMENAPLYRCNACRKKWGKFHWHSEESI